MIACEGPPVATNVLTGEILTEIEAASTRVAEETAILRKELRAFQRFQNEVRPMAVHPARPTDDEDIDCATLSDVCQAYRETVMETPGYGSDYDDDLSDSLAEEISPAVAVRLQQRAPLRSGVKRHVLEGVKIAMVRREVFLNVLDSEYESLTEAAEELTSVVEDLHHVVASQTGGDTFEEVLDVCEGLDELQRRCESIVETRQRLLVEARPPSFRLGNKDSLDDYLYAHLGFRHPVLRATTRTLEEIGIQRNESLGSVSSR